MKKIAIGIVILLFSGLVNADSIEVKGFKALPQQYSNWCWAASIQSLFLTKGMEVSQSRIVTAAYGTPVNNVAPGFMGTLRVLNGLAVSTDGSMWEVSASAVNTFPNPNWLYNELQNNNPVMIWYDDKLSNHSIIINGGIYSKDGYGGIYWHQISAYDPFKDQNIIIDAANIPRYVYGSFKILLNRLNLSEDTSEEEDTPDESSPKVPGTNCPKESTEFGFIRSECKGITKRIVY